MTSMIKLDGNSLKIADIYQISHQNGIISLDSNCKTKIDEAQKVILEAKSKNIPIYGLTRNVGQFKNESLDKVSNYDQKVLAMHSTILGDENGTKYSLGLCKSAWAIMINGFLNGGSCVTWNLIQDMKNWVNDTKNGEIDLPEYGSSIGMADAIPLMQMAIQVFEKSLLKPGEGLALLSSNALSMAEAAIFCHKLKNILEIAEMGTSLALLAENGNDSIIKEPGLEAAKHWKMKQKVIENVVKYLEGIESQSLTPHCHLALRSSCDILASVKEALEYSSQALEQVSKLPCYV